MSASPVTPPPEPRPASRGPLVAAAAIGLVWIAALAVLVARSANPVVVNRVQIWHADVVVLGVWQPGDPPRLTVERAWKAVLPAESIAVHATAVVPSTGRVVVPLTRISRDLYEVTQGELLNPPQDRRVPEKPVEPRYSRVRPLTYPATDRVIQEVEAQLSTPVPR